MLIVLSYRQMYPYLSSSRDIELTGVNLLDNGVWVFTHDFATKGLANLQEAVSHKVKRERWRQYKCRIGEESVSLPGSEDLLNGAYELTRE